MAVEPFDPTRHLTKVSGRDYLEVKWRLVWFHDLHPDGSIVTELVQHQNNIAVFRASVSWATETGIATRTGYGMESSDNFGDYLEKAETKAIGRALGAAGFGTQFCDDFAFGADQQRVVDAPTQIRSGRAQGQPRPDNRKYAQAAAHAAQIDVEGVDGPSNEYGMATEKQAKFIGHLLKQLDWSREDAERFLDANYGVHRISELGSRQDVSSFIERLQAIKEANEPPA